MAQQLENKVILITGGAGGIGFNVANKLLSEGAKTVILLDINEEQGNAAIEELNKTHGSGKAVFIHCDVITDLEAVGDRVLASYKTIDVLVNSVGIANETDPKKMIDINTRALVLWSLKFYEHMRTDKSGSGGTIINLASIFGHRITPLLPLYCTTKFAVVAFTRSLGHVYNFNKTGVRLVALCPGFTETPLTACLLDDENKAGIPEDLLEIVRRYPWQKVDAVGDGIIKIFKEANSGTALLLEGGNPIEEILY